MTNSVAAAARGLGALAIAAATTGLLAACGSTSPVAAPTKTITETAPAAGAGSAAATPSSASTSAAAHAGPARCLSSDLQAKLGVSQGTAGTIYQVVVFTNTSSAACSLYGYPGVSFVTGVGGSVIGAPATRNPVQRDELVTLQPGAQANAAVGVVDVGALPQPACKPGKADWLQVYAPGDTGALYLQYSSQVCTGKAKFLTVTSVRPGAGSSL
jgi:Protein of unknown function (DUF4232)